MILDHTSAGTCHWGGISTLPGARSGSVRFSTVDPAATFKMKDGSRATYKDSYQKVLTFSVTHKENKLRMTFCPKKIRLTSELTLSAG